MEAEQNDFGRGHGIRSELYQSWVCPVKHNDTHICYYQLHKGAKPVHPIMMEPRQLHHHQHVRATPMKQQHQQHSSCACCRGGRHHPPTAEVPMWVVTLYRLFTADFCSPRSRAPRKKTNLLHNSATTCDMSDDSSYDDSSSLLEGDEALLVQQLDSRTFGVSSKQQQQHWQSPPSRQRHYINASPVAVTTPSNPKPVHRPRLLSGTSLTLSCRTSDSRHRRSNLKELPTPDQIWRPAAVIHTRGVSAVTQLTMPSLSDHSNSSTDESLDLSESDATETAALLNGESTVLNRSFANHLAAPVGQQQQHVRNPSYCSSASESENTTSLRSGEDVAPPTVTERALQIVPQQQQQEDPTKADWTLDWLKGESSDPAAASFCGKPCTAIVPVVEDKQQAPAENKHHAPSYLPIYPVPPAASVSMAASIFSAGWCAVFYDLQLGISEVPHITGNNICFLQLLSGGMLQLTSAVDGDRKTVLVSPKSSGSNLKLLSKRIGHCLVLETSASTSFHPQQTLFVLPINLPGPFRAELTAYFSGRHAEPPEIPGAELFFTRPSQQQRYPPNPQHEAAIHLSFAMDAALRLDEAMRRRRW